MLRWFTAMTTKRLLGVSVVGLMWLSILFTAPRGFASDGPLRYEVTVTNLTQGQPLTPAVVVTHTSDFRPLFIAGEPASPELIAIAEDANVEPMVQLLSQDSNVRDVVVLQGTAPLPTPPEGPGGFAIRPGESASVVVKFGGRAKFVSLVGMLANTNDAFYALSGVAGPSREVITYYEIAWDAGSEENNEDCQFVPGPFCTHFFARATQGAEEFVYVHSGMHGVGNLVPALHDWRNPVAKIAIRRLHLDD